MTSGVTTDARIGVVGGGKMGEAIVRGLVSADAVSPAGIVVAEPEAARRELLSGSYGVSAVPEGVDAVRGASVVILAVKPQVIDVVVGSLSSAIEPGAVVISIAAGITCARLESLLPDGTAVVRVMPNTPAMVGAGMAIVSGGSGASADQVERARSLFAAIGDAIVVPESLQDAGTAISGSGPAYFALVIDALARAGVSQGLSRDLAQRLAVQTMLGTATMLQSTGVHPEALIDGVASPGGTTIAAVHQLESHGVRAAFADAVAAAVRRSKELGS
jgi:pyrroline-5-carboxylate reductase